MARLSLRGGLACIDRLSRLVLEAAAWDLIRHHAFLLKPLHHPPLPLGQHAAPFRLLKIADPSSVTINGERIPVIVQGGFREPVPLRG